MTLKLLLSLLFVVWRVAAADEYSNHWLESEAAANVQFCSHDGYLSGPNQCSCYVDYNGNYCLKRKCRNFGFDGQLFASKVDRCICPPGFLGRNCEPINCVSGAQQLYSSSKNEKAISLLASFNSKMQTDWATRGDLSKIICSKEGYWRNFNYNYLNAQLPIKATDTASNCVAAVNENLEPDPCLDDHDNPIACGNLDITNLDSLVKYSPPNSIIFVATNMNVTSATDALAENIIATSIARRIQINVLVYNNTMFYANDHGLAYLNKIATATLGNFILPSIDPKTEHFDILKVLLDNWDNGLQVSNVFTSDVQNMPVDNSIDIYVAAQSEDGLNFKLNTPPNVVVSTDYWKLYKLPAESYNTILSASGQDGNSPILVYGGLKAYSAFTSDYGDELVDGAYSVSVVDAQYTMVLRFESATSSFSYTTGFGTLGKPANVDIGSSFYNRSYCQFNIALDATCKSVGASVITVTIDRKNSVSFPVYCASFDYAASIYNNLVSETVSFSRKESRQSLAQDVTCPASIPSETSGSRSFVIICENTKDSNSSLSSADNVFRNKNSVFYQVSKYIASTTSKYSNFLAQLHQGAKSNLTKSPDYGIYMTKVMAITGSAPDHSNLDATDITQLLVDTISASNPYSDILLIIDYNATLSNAQNVKSALELQRSKLFIAFVQTYMSYGNDVYQSFNNLAIASGGVAIRLNSYIDLQTFFNQYFPLLVANDIAAKAYSKNQKAGIALSNVNLLNETYILLVTNEDLTNDGIVNATVTVSGATVAPLPQIGELQLFEITPQKNSLFNIPIAFSTSGLARYSNAVLFASSITNDFISLSFLDKSGNVRNDVVFNEGKFRPLFSSSSPFADGSTVSITYSDASNPAKPVYSGPITSCSSGNVWQTSFDWICSISDGLYHFKVDRVDSTGTTISRTFPITCLGTSSGSCLNGGTEASDKTCVCPLQWTGENCQIPRCLNGGTVTTADTCNCTTAFTGDFCEQGVAACLSSPVKPDYRSELSALTIVADAQALAVSSLTTGISVTGVPITVVLYGDGQDPRIVQSTTDGQHLSEVLGAPTNLPTPDPSSNSNDLFKALNLAVKNQITNRALYVVLTSNSNVTIDGDLLIRLAVKRAEIRILSTSGTETANSMTLSLLGNSIPIAIKNPIDFQNYMTGYITPLFNSLQYQATVPQRVFNVFQTGALTGEQSVTIPTDSTFDNANALAFVHVYKGNSNLATDKTIVGDSFIYSTTFNPKDGKTINFNVNSAGVNGYYAIEIVGYLKTEYGFNVNNTNGANEQLNSGLTRGQTNTMTILAVPYERENAADPSDYLYLSVKEILNNGTVSGPTTTIFTLKTGSNCFFRHFATLDVCSDSSTIGYQVQLTSRSATAEKRQQQFVLTCFNTAYKNGDTACGGTGSPEQTCKCDPSGLFSGLDCSEPICQNNGVRDISVCRCPVKYYGRNCQKYFGTLPTTPVAPTTLPTVSTNPTSTLPVTSSAAVSTSTQPTTVTTQTPTPAPVRVAAFIIDVIGTDDYAFNQTITSIAEYVKAFGNIHYVMLVGNMAGNSNLHFDFQTYVDIPSLMNKLLQFWNIRSIPSRTTDVIGALQTILASYTTTGSKFPNTLSSNIFYAAQTALNQDPSGSMGGLETFTKSSIFYSAFNKNAAQDDLDTLTKFSPTVTNVRDYYKGIVAMVTDTAQNSSAVLPTPPAKQSCVYGLQANIRVAIDRSASTITGIDSILRNFLENFRLGFNFIENDADRCTTAQDLPSFYKERTALTAFPYYNGYVIGSSFCPSQYTTMLSYEVTGSSPVPLWSNKTVKVMGKAINNADCSCNRFTDDKTMKFILWIPRSAGPVDEAYLAFLKLNTANAYHFIVPFYDIATDKTTDLYYQLLKDQAPNADYFWLPNAATTDVQTVIDQLYTKICETSNVDPTSVPLLLSQTDEESRQYDFSEENFA